MLQKYLISIDARLRSRNGTDSVGSLQWRSSGSDSLPLCLGHFLWITKNKVFVIVCYIEHMEQTTLFCVKDIVILVSQ